MFQTKPAGEERRRRKLFKERTGPDDGTLTQNERCFRFYFQARRIVLWLLIPAIVTLIQQSWAAGDKSLANGLTPADSKQVLVLCSYGYTLAGYQKINPAFLAVMARAGISTNDLFFEYLDLLHIRNTEHRQILADMLHHKYAGSGIDLIVTLHAPAMTFLLNEAKDVFPQVPVVSRNVPEAFKAEDGARTSTRLSISLDLQGTLERALDLFPQTERVVSIIGVSEIDKFVEIEAFWIQTYGRVALDGEPAHFDNYSAVPCGLVLNELVSNALKHAFRGRPGGEVGVSLRGGEKHRVRLSVRDNGIGLPAGFDWQQTASLGLRLVQMLSGQLHAAVKASANGGTEFTITFGEPKT